mmetsp:Transcript_5924/g.4227  ORF Transcript_5924/g.4227 Transcript_5924/m.4227 type:complete len:121 (+) Transcript_5924:30-392(+)
MLPNMASTMVITNQYENSEKALEHEERMLEKEQIASIWHGSGCAFGSKFGKGCDSNMSNEMYAQQINNGRVNNYKPLGFERRDDDEEEEDEEDMDMADGSQADEFEEYAEEEVETSETEF